jgi:hypothetical protein
MSGRMYREQVLSYGPYVTMIRKLTKVNIWLYIAWPLVTIWFVTPQMSQRYALVPHPVCKFHTFILKYVTGTRQ